MANSREVITVKPNPDPTLQSQIEAFHRSLDARASFYQQAIIFMAREQLHRDLELFNDPDCRGRRAPVKRILKRIAGLVGERLSPHPRARTTKGGETEVFPPPSTYSITVVDPDAAPPSGERRLLPDHIPDKERSLFDD